ncbi:MAG: TonB-dependent receptor, partial [bacterium]
MKSFVIVVLMTANSVAFSQNTFKAFLKDTETREPLVGGTAVIEGTTIGASADEQGYIEIKNIPDGTQTIFFSVVGYEKHMEILSFPLSSPTMFEILLHHHEKELDEVVVSSTRNSRTIVDEPTRLEAITVEELDEKSNMKPGDIRMLLNESTGIQTQQTSATTANSSIRIQGLDGRYTQILKDGFPLYSGFAGGLSIMQIPPLDLQQVEVIKGSASTLYGGGAIAGLVNLISKSPSTDRELSVLLNGTSAGGLDVSGFYG